MQIRPLQRAEIAVGALPGVGLRGHTPPHEDFENDFCAAAV